MLLKLCEITGKQWDHKRFVGMTSAKIRGAALRSESASTRPLSPTLVDDCVDLFMKLTRLALGTSHIHATSMHQCRTWSRKIHAYAKKAHRPGRARAREELWESKT